MILLKFNIIVKPKKSWLLLLHFASISSLLILQNGRRSVNPAPRIGIRGSRSANRSQVFNLFLLPYNTKLGVSSKP